MTTGFYLLDHPNPHGPHFHQQRRGPILAIVVHITAGLQDEDTFDDTSAEKTAAYAASTDRKVSWHSGSDTDSALDLLPDSHVAFHCQGYNTHTLGHEISKSTPDWRFSSGLFVGQSLDMAAKHLAAKAAKHRIPIRWATKAELDRAITNGGPPVGFIGHADLDPTRRRDPGYTAPPPRGDTFPRQRFLDLVHRHTLNPEDDMARHYRVVDVPEPDSSGRHIVGIPDFRFDLVASVTVKANDNGTPVRAVAQPFAFGNDLAVALLPIDGATLRPGAKIGLIVATTRG